MKLGIKHFTPAIVLGAICLVVAALLATINMFTSPVIEEREREAKTASLRAVFGDASGAEFGDPMQNLPTLDPDSSVVEIYEEKNGMGYAVILSVQGRDDKIGMTVGISADDGTVIGIKITKYNDSYGKNDMPTAVEQLIGKDSVDGIDLVSGATVSSTAVKTAVEDALDAVKAIKAQNTASVSLNSYESDTSAKASRVVGALNDESIHSVAEEMLGGDYTFELLTTIAPDPETEGMFAGYVPHKAHIYKISSDKGYLIHGESFNEWSFNWGPEANFLCIVDKTLTVTAFKLTGWSLSPGYNDALSDLEHPDVKSFENSFIGISLMNLEDRPDLVTQATLTSDRLQLAFYDALEYVSAPKFGTYKTVATVVFFAGIAALGVAIYFQRRRLR